MSLTQEIAVWFAALCFVVAVTALVWGLMLASVNRKERRGSQEGVEQEGSEARRVGDHPAR